MQQQREYLGVISGFSLPELNPLPAIPNGPFIAEQVRAGVNNKLYLTNYNGLFQLDTNTGAVRLLMSPPNVNFPFIIAVSADHRDLYLGFQDHYPGMIAHYDIAAPIPVLLEQRTALGYVGDMAVSPDGKSLVYEDSELVPAGESSFRRLHWKPARATNGFEALLRRFKHLGVEV